MLTKEQYRADPCKAASIPYWKAKSITVPDGMKILHQDEYDSAEYQNYIDEPYFRLIHDLKGLSKPVLPQGYSLCTAPLSEYAAHINSCYDGIGITEAELRSYTTRPVYDAALWLAVKDNQTGTIVATGIAELDREIGEGVLEWIQVSESYRGKGLGRYFVSELLWRLKGKADFVTVSGQCSNAANPEKLYRKCCFTGANVWHILRKRKIMISEITCRMMAESDIDLVVPLYIEHYNTYEDGEWTQETTYKRIHQVWSREDSLCMILEQSNEVIGFVMGYFEQYDDIQAYDLVEIVIAHEHQGKGIGTQFMGLIEAKVKELGGSMIQLQAVNDDMHNSFYGKLNYQNCNNLVLKSKWL